MDSPPRIWLPPILSFIGVVFALDLWASYWVSLTFFTFTVGFWICVIFVYGPDITTQLCQDGIHQFNLRGWRRIAWEDVVEVKQERKNLWLVAKDTKVHVRLSVFEDPVAAEAYIYPGGQVKVLHPWPGQNPPPLRRGDG
jgi:hypothetical protein